MNFSVQVYFNDFGNHEPRIVVGQVRRLADEFGKPGIMAKKGQNNRRVFRKGYLRLVWPTRRLARAFQALVEEMWGHLVSTRRFRVQAAL
jgi:hypothetical protein